jgi:ABC-type sugar transport system ATPase subunit
MLRAANITKKFGSVTVLNNIDFELGAGEIHALFGANGAGKSTLSKIIAGHILPTQGKVFVNNQECTFKSPRGALEAGLAMVMQETSLAPDLSVLENIFLPLHGRHGIFRPKTLRPQALEILDQLGVANEIQLDARTGNLSAAHRQLVEIARALALNAKVIIFDEPTTSLSPSEVACLFRVMGRLRNEGCAMIFVSHRLEELFAITDRVTVLRDGGIAASGFKTTDLSQTELVRLMIGRELGRPPAAPTDMADEAKPNISLQVENLASGPLVKDISFDLHEGEILGLGGLVGAGRSETLEAIFGLRTLQAGRMLLNGVKFSPRRPLDAIKLGVGFVAEDRRAQSILPDLSVRENLTVAALSAQGSILANYGRYREHAEQLARKLDLPTDRLDDENLLGFSGGMQQKILIMRWLLLKPRVLLLDEPTKGIDIGARTAIYAVLRQIASEGVSILVVSSDFQELIELCDRVVPISDGRSIGSVPSALLDEEKLLILAAPRSSMSSLKHMLQQVSDKHGVESFWAILARDSLICLAASERSERLVGFSTGNVCSTKHSRIPNALNKAMNGSVITEVDGTCTLLVGVSNARGHDLGLVGFVSQSPMSTEQEALVRADLQSHAQQQIHDQITLSI